MKSLTPEEFRERMEAAHAYIDNLCEWMKHEAMQRVAHRAWGRMEATLFWEDGSPKGTEVNSRLLTKGETTKLPHGTLDGGGSPR